MSHSDSNFYKSFAFVLGALVLFTLFIMFIAKSLSPDAPADPLAVKAQQEAIAPVGKLRVEASEEELSAAAPVVEPKPAVETAEVVEAKPAEVVEAKPAEVVEAKVEETVEVKTVEPVAVAKVATAATAATAAGAMASVTTAEIPVKVRATVATNCAGCHNGGINGAARSDDAEAWHALGEKGIDQLTASVINGKGSMPARGGSKLNDDELKQAVQLMYSKATGGASKRVSSGVAAVAATTAAAASTTAAATTTTETTTATAEPVAAVIPDEVKQIVDSTCAACHIAGVANAPKYGDKDAWDARMVKGLDAVVASAIAGKGAMPARGGAQLNDEQMRQAVEYMLSK